jgi:AcrR family transcriptional regulator
MKISQEQKTENRRNLIRAAVDLVIEKGGGAITMREVARRAGVGDATIYNYFPTKESIFFAYYEDHAQACMDKIKAMDSFHTFSLQEQLQTFFDVSLDLYLPDREFVDVSFKKIWLGGSGHWGRLKPIRSQFIAAIQDMISAAEEVGEIPEQVFQELMGQFFLDAYIAAVLYWLSDTSDEFQNTMFMMDRGLDLACSLMKAGIANKIFDVAVFLFKNHVLSRMDSFAAPLKDVERVKRKFMETAQNG